MSLAISATVTEFSEIMSQKAGTSSGNDENSGQGMESSATSSCIHGIEVTGEDDDDEEEENGLASNSRRGRSKVLLWLEESDSDEEGNGSSSKVSAWKPEPTDFANDGTAAFSAGSNRKLRRVRNTMSDSDSESCLTFNSEREDQSQNESKGRRRSRRDGAKETVKQIKKKNGTKLLKKKEIKQNPNNSEEAVQISQNDSALPFADSDLFDRELSDSEEDFVKAHVKNKVLKSKKQHLRAVTNDEDEKAIPQLNKDPPKRAERKAAKVSKAALQKIHSETQRLIRESNTSLPYHLPEPKSIHDFFKRRSHQPGNSGISSRYSKTQPNSLTNDVNLSGDFHLVSTTEGTPDKPELSATPEANNENLGVQACVSIEVLEESGNFQEERNGNFTEAADQHSIEPSHGPLLAAVIETPDKTGDECATSNDKTSAENVACSNTSNGGDKQVNVVSAVHSLLEKPKTLGVDFTVQPRISAPANNFIDLTEVPNTGMEKFQQRFLRHVVASANPPAGNGKQETDKLAGERSMENALTSGHASLREKPGAGRLLLKAKLREEMRKRRETERCRRWEAYNMETGKGFEEDVEEEEEVPDLGEKCDRTNDSDLELDPESKTSKDEGRKEESFHFETAESLQQEDDLENLSMLPANEGHSRKIFPTASEASLVLFEHTNSGSHIQSFEGSIRLGECGQVESCAESDEEHGYGHDSSFDLSSSTIPPYQPMACSQANSHFRSPSPNLVSPLSQYQIPCGSSVTMSSGKCSEIQLPVENSQDLYQMSLDPILGLGASQAGDLNFHFSLNEDMDSETCEPTTDRLVERFHMPNSKRKLNLESLEENAMDGNMDELLGLCSGSFPSPCDEQDSRSADVLPSKIMDISIDEGEGGMSELLELCSGKFPSQDSQGESRPWNSSTKMCDVEKVADAGQTDSKTSLHAETTRGAEEEEEWLQMTSDEEAFKINAKWKKGLRGGSEGNDLIVEGEVSEDEDDLDGGENNKEGNDLKKNLEDELVEKDEVEEEGEDEVEGEEEDEDDVEDGEDKSDEEEEEEEYYLKTRPPKELRLHNFVEEEAALSDIEGSVSEDEDEVGEDLYEEEENDEVLPSQRKLQSQVKRLHMKAIMDDDKRQLRLYQERYLLDGDLHSDGAGRQRCFRWKNLNDHTQTELFRNDADLSGDDEQPHNHVEEEVKRIKERLDRELWKRKKSEEASEDDEEYNIAEDNQFMKMAKKYVNGNICKTDTSLSLTKKVENNPTLDGMLGIPLHLQFSAASTTRRVQLGSLLAQPKEELQRLAGVASNCEPPPGTAHTNNRRSFVFQALSPDPKVEKREKVANKRSLTKPSSPPVTTSCVKRPRQEVPKQPRSVFSFL